MASHWKRVRYQGQKLYQVGVYDDGSLWNPNGYEEATVRAAVQHAENERAERRSEAAKKAAEKRRRRQRDQINKIAREIADGANLGPRENCVICGRGLADNESIQRGVGSECWQSVLEAVEANVSAASGDLEGTTAP